MGLLHHLHWESITESKVECIESTCCTQGHCKTRPFAKYIPLVKILAFGLRIEFQK